MGGRDEQLFGATAGFLPQCEGGWVLVGSYWAAKVICCADWTDDNRLVAGAIRRPVIEAAPRRVAGVFGYEQYYIRCRRVLRY